MLPFVEEHVPELLLQRSSIAFSRNLHLERGRDRHNATSSLVLARNLKFYEFRRKQLLHHIDLRGTRLQRWAVQLESYSGPVSNFLPKEPDSFNGQELDCSMLSSPEDLPIQIGKYVWQQDQIYILLHCWELFLVLRRPKGHGCNFELVAQHLDVALFRMIGGPIPYQAYVELQFGSSGKRLCTDFQEPPLDEGPSTSSKASASASASATVSVSSQKFERLVQQVHSARAELSSQRAQTQRDFARSQDLQTFGPPGQRSLLLEEKQLLRRFGDVWTRVCGDYLVCGCLMVNIAGSHRMSIVQELRPLVRLEPPPPNISLEHRLYELPLQADSQPPEDYDELAQFWACQEQHSRRLNWREVAKAAQLPPECSAVLVVRLRLADLLQAEQLHLMAVYEVRSVQEKQLEAEAATEIRQLHLVSLDARKLLDDMEAQAPTFAASTLHQDFLAVIVTQKAHCTLRLEFQAAQDCTRFEQLLASKLQFELIQAQDQTSHLQLLDGTCSETDFELASDPDSVQRIFHNRQPLSQWCGILLLRDDPGQHWHVYAPTEARLRLLLHHLMRDLLQLHCNLTLLEMSEHNPSPADDVAALELEASLGEELQAWTALLRTGNGAEKRLEQLQHIQSLQMVSDVLAATVIRRQNDQE
ncbi:uncharacterized protein LOC110187037 [Drosophila serrata]|uniref:uncharacterized protein LOC110187037 n=1 Tax=Drosophila serrata TaxID=7274 RepID=UPI000A1D119B|nr:uncharacterized protein LOC110187037 [Drosophila serrata]